MAKKDTLNALVKRGVDPADAAALVASYNSLSAIGEASVEDIVAAGVPEDRAESILKAVRSKPASSSSKARKAVVQTPEPVRLFETSVKFGECDGVEKKL
jgi:hypothetical protein